MNDNPLAGLDPVLVDTIQCADYLTLMSALPDKSVDLIVTDPPFGIGYSNNYTHDQHAVLDGDDGPFSYAKFGAEAYRVLRPNSAIFAFTGWSEYPKHYTELSEAGFSMKEPVICQKRPSGKTDLYGTFQSNADWVMFGHKGRFVFRPTELLRNKRAGTVPNAGRKPVAEFKTRFPSCWFGSDYPWSSENSSFQRVRGLEHPTIKGQTFIEWLILLGSMPGALVLDPFIGSGTTAAAALATSRHYVGGDVSREFVTMARRRVASQRAPSDTESPGANVTIRPNPIADRDAQ